MLLYSRLVYRLTIDIHLDCYFFYYPNYLYCFDNCYSSFVECIYSYFGKNKLKPNHNFIILSHFYDHFIEYFYYQLL